MAILASIATESMEGADPANDSFHAELAIRIAESLCGREGSDFRVVKAALLIHNIVPRKRIDGHVTDYRSESLQKGREVLLEAGFPPSLVPKILNCVEAAYFGNEGEATSIEAKVTHDANKLVTMGALAIARTFTYGGYFKRPIFDPQRSLIHSRRDITQALEAEYDPYAIDRDSISHFKTKLLRIKDTMLTKTGQELAEQRHEFMILFLNQFFDELDIDI
ncbi:MAG: hypothetical protein WAW52_11830 [Methanothrix sp.]